MPQPRCLPSTKNFESQPVRLSRGAIMIDPTAAPSTSATNASTGSGSCPKVITSLSCPSGSGTMPWSSSVSNTNRRTAGPSLGRARLIVAAAVRSILQLDRPFEVGSGVAGDAHAVAIDFAPQLADALADLQRV